MDAAHIIKEAEAKLASMSLPSLQEKDLAKRIDHTLLKPDATSHDIERLCQEALEYQFRAVCVHPSFVRLASTLLQHSSVMVCTVIGFPLGATSPGAKMVEADLAVRDGATELDMVMHIGRFKERDYRYVRKDIEAVVKATEGAAITKVIIETALLTDEEKVWATKIVVDSGAHFVKTSTGFGPGGATVRDVAILSAAAGGRIQVKAAGGIRTPEQALQMIAAGASRIGTSRGPALVTGGHAS